MPRPWQDTQTILALCGPTPRRAIPAYRITGPHFGPGPLRRVRAILAGMGLALGMTLEPGTLDAIKERLDNRGERNVARRWRTPHAAGLAAR